MLRCGPMGLLLLLLAWQGIAVANDQFDDFIAEASQAYGVDSRLIRSVIRQESQFDPNAQSAVGAQGLMQLMPDTASDMGVSDRLDPRQNIMGGTRYLAQQLATNDGNVVLALAAYNAGPGRVQRYGGVPPFEETVTYIRRISGFLEESGYGALALSGLPESVSSTPASTSGPSYKPINTPSLSTVMASFEAAVGIQASAIRRGLVYALIVIILVWLSWQVLFVVSGLREHQFSVTSSLIYIVRSLALASIFITFISN